jgi:hypothetical protein
MLAQQRGRFIIHPQFFQNIRTLVVIDDIRNFHQPVKDLPPLGVAKKG